MDAAVLPARPPGPAPASPLSEAHRAFVAAARCALMPPRLHGLSHEGYRIAELGVMQATEAFLGLLSAVAEQVNDTTQAGSTVNFARFRCSIRQAVDDNIQRALRAAYAEAWKQNRERWGDEGPAEAVVPVED